MGYKKIALKSQVTIVTVIYIPPPKRNYKHKKSTHTHNHNYYKFIPPLNKKLHTKHAHNRRE